MTDADWAALRGQMVKVATARFGPAEAEDVVQDATVSFFRRERDVDPMKMRPYMLQAVRNAGIHRWRAARRSPKVVRTVSTVNGNEMDVEPSAIVDFEALVDDRERLAEVRAELGTAVIAVILATCEEGYTAVARRLGTKPTYLRVLVCRVRRLLRGDDKYGDRSQLKRFRALAERLAAATT